MNINTRSHLMATYHEMSVNVDKVKHRIDNQKWADSRKTDECCISEVGKSALEEKMPKFHDNTMPHITEKLSNISPQSYVDMFGEKLQATEKSEDMDAFFVKMQLLHEELQKEIESKYDNSKQEDIYFVSLTGDVEKLTKEKELELLRFAYESHKELMTNSMKIWEKGFQICK